jgi:hypothetical protein
VFNAISVEGVATPASSLKISKALITLLQADRRIPPRVSQLARARVMIGTEITNAHGIHLQTALLRLRARTPITYPEGRSRTLAAYPRQRLPHHHQAERPEQPWRRGGAGVARVLAPGQGGCRCRRGFRRRGRGGSAEGQGRVCAGQGRVFRRGRGGFCRGAGSGAGAGAGAGLAPAGLAPVRGWRFFQHVQRRDDIPGSARRRSRHSKGVANDPASIHDVPGSKRQLCVDRLYH